MTTSSVPTPDTLLASFPYTKLPTQAGRPNFKHLHDSKKLQQANAAEIRTTLGGGAHGYLGALMSAANYAIIAPGTPFVAPIYPGTYPIIPAGATGAQIRVITQEHTEAMRQFTEYNAVQLALKKQLIESIEPAYVEGYKEPFTQFGNRTINGFYDWLFDMYGRQSAMDKSKNDLNFRKDWDPSMPFEAFTAKMEECVEIAEAAGSAFSPQQVLDNAQDLVFKTGLYFEPIKQWNRRPAIEKTWANFKLHMAQAQAELIEEQATAMRGGYGHAANAALQLEAATEALANLATATAMDRTTLANMTNMIKEKDAQIKKLLEAAKTSAKATGEVRTKGNTKPPPDPNGYCWKHGYRVCVGHNSMTCSNAATDPEHKKEATRENNMGGSQRGKP